MTMLPINWTLQNYRNVWLEHGFPGLFLEQLQGRGDLDASSACSSRCTRPMRSRASNFTGRYAYGLLLLVTQMFPHILLVIPLFIIIRNIGLFNTHAALIIAYTAFSLPFNIWLLRGFFEAIPEELEDAAAIDGASHARHVPPGHPAARRTRPRRCDHVRLHPRLERVPVRAGVPAERTSCSRCRSGSRASRRSSPSAGT